MNIRRTDRLDPDFYRLMGPVFGSRRVEKETKDRFYDDPGKVWYVGENCAASIVGGAVVKNFWALDGAKAKLLAQALMEEYEYFTGIVPNTFQAVFESMGVAVKPYKKNYIEVTYEKD